MAVQTGQGARFYIGPANEVADELAEFEGLAYTEVGEVQNIGEFGKNWNQTTFVSLGDSIVRKFKTTKDNGSPQVTVGFDSGDAGQQAVETAVDSRSDYAIKITLNDAGTSSPANPTTWYFRAKVMSNNIAGISTEDIVLSNVNLGINSDVIRQDASI